MVIRSGEHVVEGEFAVPVNVLILPDGEIFPFGIQFKVILQLGPVHWLDGKGLRTIENDSQPALRVGGQRRPRLAIDHKIFD